MVISSLTGFNTFILMQAQFHQDRIKREKDAQDNMKPIRQGSKDKVPTNLPTFRDGRKDACKDPTSYIKKFEAVMKAVDFPRTRWTICLKSQCSTAQMAWIQSAIIDINMEWQEAKVGTTTQPSTNTSKQKKLKACLARPSIVF